MLDENEGRFFSKFDGNVGRFGFMFDENDGILFPIEDGKEGFGWNDGFFLSLLKDCLSRVDSNDGKSIDGGDGNGRLAFLRNFLGGIFDGVGEGEGDGDT